MSELHVVLGATGGAGSAVVEELQARGKRIRATSRRPPQAAGPNIEWMALDALDAAGVETACEGATTVYHCVNVPYADWERKLIPIADHIVAGAASAGASLVVTDNLYMYGPSETALTETTLHRPAGHKGRLRGELERRYMEAHRSGKVRLAIGRASDFYGAAGSSAPVLLALDPMLLGKPPQWLANLDMPHTLSYLPDVGWGLVTLGEQPQAFGQVWHIPAAEPLTGRQFVAGVAEVIGGQPRIGVITRPMLLLAGLFNAQIREAAEVFYQFARPFVMDGNKFDRAFGSRITPHSEAIPRTVAERRTLQ